MASLTDMEIEGVAGQGGGDVTLSGPPFCISPGFPSVVARSKRLSYRDYGSVWEVTEKNGFYSPFEYQG
jgi:hypothetical protein